MNRRDLFKKIITKSIDFSLEKGEGIAESFKLTSQNLDGLTTSINTAKDKYLNENVSLGNSTKKQKNDKISKSNSSNRNTNYKYTKKITNGLTPPPGAIQPESKFVKKCTGCSDCVFSCPYNAIFPIYNEEISQNLPYMDVNSNACRMCKDWPCITACSYGALKPIKIKNLKLGQARGIFHYCINSHTGDKTCNACQESCPVEKTVSIKKNKPSFAKSCTGCGLCVQSCPTYPKAIQIV